MTDVLSDKLVKKYFGCWGNGATMPERVLNAMQEPIRKGERYLQQTWSGHNSMTIGFEERVYDGVSGYGKFEEDHFHTGYHSRALRLPNRFQGTGKNEGEPSEARLLMETHIARFHTPPVFHDPPTPAPECCRDKTHQGPCVDCMCSVCKTVPETRQRSVNQAKMVAEFNRANDYPGIVQPNPVEAGGCGCACHATGDKTSCGFCFTTTKCFTKTDSETAVEELIQQIKLDVYAKVQADATCDMEHLNKQLRALVALARGAS